MIESENVPISRLTTFQNSGTVKRVVVVEELEELRHFLTANSSFSVLGKGSNTLINHDTAIPVFLKISPDMVLPSFRDGVLEVSAGVSVHQLLSLCQLYGIGGLDFCAGVPAGVGGMVAMNFGCWGRCIADVVMDVTVMDGCSGKVCVYSSDECGFGYRTSRFQGSGDIIISARFKCVSENASVLKKRISDAVKKRLATQPLKGKTFGSIFKNPQGDFAAKLIEESGLKGKHFDQVSISDLHANFLINDGNASYNDAVESLETIRKLVLDKTGKTLELEVKLVP